jgi:hypothetical protein
VHLGVISWHAPTAGPHTRLSPSEQKNSAMAKLPESEKRTSISESMKAKRRSLMIKD